MQQQTSNISPIANGQCTESTRLPWLDFASGIMILWMIVYHAIQVVWGYELRDLWHITDIAQLPDGVHAFINSDGKLEALNPCVVFPWLHFFMPWFFYKSGQFFRKRSIKELWQKDTHKLLKAFVIWSAVGYVFFLFFGLLNDTLTLRGATYSVIRGLFLRGYVPINGPCWFLLTLLGVRFVANIALPERGDKYTVLKYYVVAVGYVISYLAYRFNHRLLPYWVANGAAGLSFFALGYALRDWEQKWWVVVPSMLVYIVGCAYGFPTVDMFDNVLLKGSCCLWIPLALCCIIFFNALCRVLYKYLRIKPIELIGRNAMTILVIHCLIYASISTIFGYFNIQNRSIGYFFLILVAYAIILPISCWVGNRIKSHKKILCE